MLRIPNNPASYLAFASAHSTVGLMEWPAKMSLGACAGVVAHPGPPAGVAITSDGRFILTAAAGGSVVTMFHVRAALSGQPALASLYKFKQSLNPFRNSDSRNEPSLQDVLFEAALHSVVMCALVSGGDCQHSSAA